MRKDTKPLNTVGGDAPRKPHARVKKTPASVKSAKPGEMAAKYGDTKPPVSEIADTIDPNKPLTEMAKRFVRFWAEGESVSAASARAGYANPSMAYRLIYYPQAIALYQEEKAKYEESCQMTRKRVMEGLLEGVDMAKLEGEAMAVIAGWREIGRMCGYYEPTKQQININVTGSVAMERLNKLSDAELLDLITNQIQAPAPLALGSDHVSPGADLAEPLGEEG